MEDPRIISALFIFLKMAYYNVLINNMGKHPTGNLKTDFANSIFVKMLYGKLNLFNRTKECFHKRKDGILWIYRKLRKYYIICL
ncbi:hypothetical protein RUMGNA_00056 [Mediterraneibacter gnavus ATCC 29149]|uniref:Uncharacterized protein n=1 Tax=Mediterraneibacter gnavus (strain ATCC 29149 / DSM 114966 / JCM 6515 / VPI C7-9) TaxID=411470 RepID=A7AXP4_MEDG7|nr:hypothetical protein RUMGNA_00056 [Mediterraneibacter gnavus ATCC 29149]